MMSEYCVIQAKQFRYSGTIHSQRNEIMYYTQGYILRICNLGTGFYFNKKTADALVVITLIFQLSEMS